ncbi:hypothetical protein N657DRAFT_164874 [Parathielavia appendiculata]|uniref:Oxo-4-hydroxy-4-carboxy-5-ureidoimidazoline decarboxylase domain-containing protein n=1 Tax=Parathielavia appendiculata TaxID=2587402 RepID=A0AAN6TT51_9PEZI|nr:hypothetical protein N657DRAFT_164874 [Parathielavia appendiculata]
MSSPLHSAATPFLPAITSLPTLSDTALTSTIDLLFEPSPDLHALALPTVRALSFASYDDLIATLRTQLLDLTSAVRGDEEGRGRRTLYGILGSHPRLGEKKNKGVQGEGQGGLSQLSAEEQRHLREEDEELAGLNREYEERFPGLRYVVWVNGRGRGEVMADMRRRIRRGDIREEEKEGIQAMCDIAVDRAHKLVKKAAEEAAGSSQG